jgi:hypothetical protein
MLCISIILQHTVRGPEFMLRFVKCKEKYLFEKGKINSSLRKCISIMETQRSQLLVFRMVSK